MDVDIKTQQCIVMINDSTMLSWAAIELDLDPLVINFDKSYEFVEKPFLIRVEKPNTCSFRLRRRTEILMQISSYLFLRFWTTKWRLSDPWSWP